MALTAGSAVTMIRAPMARPLEDTLDVGHLAAQRAELERDFPVGSFARLRGSLARPDGVATARFQFHEVAAYPALAGEVRATAWLVCQRCLQEFETVLASPVRVAFVWRDADASKVPDEYDAVTAPAGRIQLGELVEDELLLALPLVPMHATPMECALQLAAVVEGEAAPGTAVVEAKSPVHKPFADLRGLLKR